MNAAQQLLSSFGVGSKEWYKAPHANRSGWNKKASLRNRREERRRARQYLKDHFDDPQPVKHMHSARRNWHQLAEVLAAKNGGAA